MEELANSDLSKKNSRHNRRGNDSGGKESIWLLIWDAFHTERPQTQRTHLLTLFIFVTVIYVYLCKFMLSLCMHL